MLKHWWYGYFTVANWNCSSVKSSEREKILVDRKFLQSAAMSLMNMILHTHSYWSILIYFSNIHFCFFCYKNYCKKIKKTEVISRGITITMMSILITLVALSKLLLGILLLIVMMIKALLRLPGLHCLCACVSFFNRLFQLLFFFLNLTFKRLFLQEQTSFDFPCELNQFLKIMILWSHWLGKSSVLHSQRSYCFILGCKIKKWKSKLTLSLSISSKSFDDSLSLFLKSVWI